MGAAKANGRRRAGMGGGHSGGGGRCWRARRSGGYCCGVSALAPIAGGSGALAPRNAPAPRAPATAALGADGAAAAAAQGAWRAPAPWASAPDVLDAHGATAAAAQGTWRTAAPRVLTATALAVLSSSASTDSGMAGIAATAQSAAAGAAGAAVAAQDTGALVARLLPPSVWPLLPLLPPWPLRPARALPLLPTRAGLAWVRPPLVALLLRGVGWPAAASSVRAWLQAAAAASSASAWPQATAATVFAASAGGPPNAQPPPALVTLAMGAGAVLFVAAPSPSWHGLGMPPADAPFAVVTFCG
ncbi:Holliday junction resolvase MOC1, chloroplastic-like [Panicum virgatum]|uniref:Holliday junction resolvase MOC1, chloroplastic-like n=1 Tax=Panicum virgatum TaxID=38727 RepID=UPI0019D543DB|nr:Holliday junction resolvase MOC1, chloroplastic-like [Panicum virgatum]